MKILSLGLDNSLLEKNSRLAGRVVSYGNLVEKYTVIVPADKDEETILSSKVKVYGRGGSNKMIKLFRIFKLGEKILREEKYDLVTVQDQYFLGWFAWKLARRFKIGLEIQVHGFEKFFGLRKMIAKFIIPRADAVRVVSQRLKKELINDFGVAEEKITVVQIYVDVAKKTGSFELRSQDDKFIFLTVGRLVEVKNIGMQIEAMGKVAKEYKNAELWIVGDGPLMSEVGCRISELKLNGKIKLLGWQSDLEKFYSQADAFLLTSNYEGWGMAVIEAAAWGLPIIMTDVGCAGEVIKGFEHAATNGVHSNENKEASGIVIPIGGQKELEAAMRKIIEDGDLRQKLGSNAKKAVEKLPGKEKTLELYMESWEKASTQIYK